MAENATQRGARERLDRPQSGSIRRLREPGPAKDGQAATHDNERDLPVATRSPRAKRAAASSPAAPERARPVEAEMPPGPTAFDPEAAARAFGSNVGEMWRSMSGLSLPMKSLTELQSNYVQSATALWNQSLQAIPGLAAFGGLRGMAEAAPPVEAPPAISDRRFSGSDWASNPGAAYLAQMYLLNARTLMQMADSIQGEEKTKARIRFAVQQWIDASSPANFLALNPEAQRKAIETGGESIAYGIKQLIHDVQQGHVSQTDESVFEVGRNVATTEGAVVFENHIFQLLEYKPLTAKVYTKPFLFVPPCINKYYILDLQPENSVIRYAVEQGHRVFVISWRNADDSMAQLTWDDYIEDAALKAISVVQEICGCEGEDSSVNMLGFCVGGTILATALAVLAARGQQPASSLTLLTAFLDFCDTGVLDIFVDEAAVQLREMTIGPASPTKGGLLKGSELASTFSFLRPNDLVWNYVVGNYLKGEAPPPFDLLFWNSDSTNLPGPMYCWYLRNTYHENNLVKPGRAVVLGEKIDLGAIRAPAFLYGSREDHIVPWAGAYRSTQVLKGPSGTGQRPKDVTFVLGASGHIAGVINPPAKKKRSHWVSGTSTLPANSDDWFATAKETPGSWWPVWSEWLAGHAGAQIAAPKTYGSRTHKAIEPAPGRYVKQKA
jgi:polyhydroxyalkanoate synthase subunit PhaC